jgi:hypothetical protein
MLIAVNKKKVTFKNDIRIRYVLNREENSMLKNVLWCGDDEYLEFEKSARCELKTLLLIHPKMSLNDARTLLYQPDNLKIYNPYFFDK